MAGLQKVEEEKEQAQEEVAATAEIPQESAGTTVEETPATEEEPVKPETEIPHIDTEKLQERLSRSFQEILSGFNRTKAVDALRHWEEQQEQKFRRNLKHKKKIWKTITYRIWSRKL